MNLFIAILISVFFIIQIRHRIIFFIFFCCSFFFISSFFILFFFWSFLDLHEEQNEHFQRVKKSWSVFISQVTMTKSKSICCKKGKDARFKGDRNVVESEKSIAFSLNILYHTFSSSMNKMHKNYRVLMHYGVLWWK